MSIEALHTINFAESSYTSYLLVSLLIDYGKLQKAKLPALYEICLIYVTIPGRLM